MRADRVHCAEDAGGAAHVELHRLHALRRLDRDAAGIEAEPFADEDDRLAAGRPLLVLEHDELRILRRSLRDGEERAHLLRLHLGATEHGDAHAASLGDVARRIGEKVGRADVAREHASCRARLMPSPMATPRCTTAFADASSETRICALSSAGLALVFGRSAARGGVFPRAHRESDGDRFDGRFALLIGEPGKRSRAELARLTRCDTGGAPEPGDDAGGLAESYEEDTLRALGSASEQERLVARTAKVFSIERAFESAAQGGVDCRERGCERGARGKRENEQRRVGRVRLRAACGDPEFHRRCSKRSAQGGTRTRMARKPLHFECSASTNSATRASVVPQQLTRISPYLTVSGCAKSCAQSRRNLHLRGLWRFRRFLCRTSC